VHKLTDMNLCQSDNCSMGRCYGTGDTVVYCNACFDKNQKRCFSCIDEENSRIIARMREKAKNAGFSPYFLNWKNARLTCYNANNSNVCKGDRKEHKLSDMNLCLSLNCKMGASYGPPYNGDAAVYCDECFDKKINRCLKCS
jgi:hypothetical protein